MKINTNKVHSSKYVAGESAIIKIERFRLFFSVTGKSDTASTFSIRNTCAQGNMRSGENRQSLCTFFV